MPVGESHFLARVRCLVRVTFAGMRERITHLWGLMPEGTGDVLELLAQLLVVLALIGWAYNRGFRPVERGPLIRLPLLIPAFGLGLIVHFVDVALWQTLVIAASIIVAGFFGRFNQGRGMAVPVMLVATLLGLNLELSAFALTVVATLVYLLSPVKKR